jgi:hypothetical protein
MTELIPFSTFEPDATVRPSQWPDRGMLKPELVDAHVNHVLERLAGQTGAANIMVGTDTTQKVGFWGTPPIDDEDRLMPEQVDDFVNSTLKHYKKARWTDQFAKSLLPTGIAFDDSGKTLYAPDSENKTVFKFNLDPAYDVSTAKFSGDSKIFTWVI